MPPNKWASPLLHSQEPPSSAHAPWRLHVSAPPRSQQHESKQPELKAHGPPLGCFRVQTPPVQNSSDEHCPSTLHGVPGHTPPNRWASPALHSQVPPPLKHAPCSPHVGAPPPADVQQQKSVQPELKAHGPPVGCFRVQTPPVQNSIVEHWESWPQGVPGHTPPNRPASPAAHWHVPPLAAQPVWVLQTLPDTSGTVQQHESRQPELKLHVPPLASFRVQTPLVQNSIDEH
jgi:hypothetical protein